MLQKWVKHSVSPHTFSSGLFWELWCELFAVCIFLRVRLFRSVYIMLFLGTLCITHSFLRCSCKLLWWNQPVDCLPPAILSPTSELWHLWPQPGALVSSVPCVSSPWRWWVMSWTDCLLAALRNRVPTMSRRADCALSPPHPHKMPVSARWKSYIH